MSKRSINQKEVDVAKFQHLFKGQRVTLPKKESDIYDIVNHHIGLNDPEEPFYVTDLGDVVRQYEKWNTHLPNIRPYYAIKCNPDPLVLRILYSLGCGFDCASSSEIDKAFEAGASPADIVYAHPCKMASMIEYAKKTNVQVITIDTEQELHKMVKIYPEAKLVLRLAADDTHSDFKFSRKFGCEVTEGEYILKIAKELKAKVIGVSFHVGSGCHDPTSFSKAIRDSRILFECGKSLGFEMTLLDIGGGFPGRDTESDSFVVMAKEIKHALNEHFSDWSDLKVISEPGRYFIATAFTFVTRVIGKKVLTDSKSENKVVRYNLNEGMFNGFYNILFEFVIPSISNNLPLSRPNTPLQKSILFGPIGTNFDLIAKDIDLPELEVGEYLIHPDMGAYTTGISPGQDGYAGFNKPKINYYFS